MDSCFHKALRLKCQLIVIKWLHIKPAGSHQEASLSMIVKTATSIEEFHAEKVVIKLQEIMRIDIVNSCCTRTHTQLVRAANVHHCNTPKSLVTVD